MSFFDKFFSNRQRNNNENAFKPETKTISFRTSHLTISKDQIRFVLFRECEKRGRKLLFDSYSVEKVLLSSTEKMCYQKCQHQSEKSADFIETHKTHGYKYKKPPNDVSSLEEMVFGSVAVIYKAENSCKIHRIPSPKRLMFTTLVHAPFCRSPGSLISELNVDHSNGSSLASLSRILNQRPTSSSDSKLYKHKGVAQKYSSTYPWIKQNFPPTKTKQCCEISDVDYNMTRKSFLEGSSELQCLDSLYPEKRTYNESERDFSILSKNNLCSCQKNSEYEGNSLSNYDSSGITSNVSSVSGSASSLRRRWDHSYSTSLDSTTYEDTSSSPSKKRTKLGLALILDLSNTLEDEIEKFLFNHTILIDGIMAKLQDSVELAYIRNESFVDLIYTAFLECQDSIYELITGGKYETPMWSTVLGEADEGLETGLTGISFHKNNPGTFNNRDLVNNVQLKFLNDFCDVLIKFDTKDTNFFISTLLTAVLTHHLSWVPTVAETDPIEKLSVINNIRPYNPIWAQMNDLCGLLGSPLKSAKTVLTGPESKKDQLVNIIEVLTYFIRCSNVLENIYDLDIGGVIEGSDLEDKRTCDTNAETDGCSGFTVVNFEKNFFSSTVQGSETEKFNDGEQGCWRKSEETPLFRGNLKRSESGKGLKHSKSFLSRVKVEDGMKGNELYPDIQDLAKRENIRISDLNESENERTIAVDDFLTSEKLKEKIQKMIRVPSNSATPHVEGHLSPDEGYETIDSTKTDNFRGNKVQMERQHLAPESRKENIVFLLGENEKLVNLQKKVVVSKSSFVDMEREDSNEFLNEEQNFSLECGEDQSERPGWTLDGSGDNGDRTFWVIDSDNSAERYRKKDESVSVKLPWTVRELSMPKIISPCRTRRLEVSSMLGGVNQHYRSEQVVQAVLEPMSLLEKKLQKDLFLSAHNPILEKNVTETLCIVGDMYSWEVTVLSSNKSVLDCNKRSGVRVGMSQLVADMLESFLCLHTCNLSPSFCLMHIEKKLHEIYLKSKMVAELLDTRELCSMDYLTTSLDIGINDVPLLMSVATTHSPHLSEKYALSYS